MKMSMPLPMIAGFGASLFCVTLCGISIAFNVYAVALKEVFNLTQTQDELLGAFGAAGWSGVFLGAVVRQRCGYQACYVMTTFLLTSWGFFMWMSTLYPVVFKNWLGLMYLFQYCGTAGGGIGVQLLPSITVEHFPKHTGKVIGVYSSLFALGNVFYSALYQIVFQEDPKRLGQHFLTCGIIIAGSFPVCAILHRPPVKVTGDQETTTLIANNNKEIAASTEPNDTDRKIEGCRFVFTSCSFYLMLIPAVLSFSIAIAYIDNITLMAESVGLTNFLDVIFLVTAGLFVLRPLCGAIYDHFQSQKVGVFILLFGCGAFCVAMFLGIFALNEVTVYIMAILSSLICAAGYPLLLTMMTSEFGTQHYSVLAGAIDTIGAPVSALYHLATGITYDKALAKMTSPDVLCPQCFYWMLIMLMISTMVVSIFLFIYLLKTKGLKEKTIALK